MKIENVSHLLSLRENLSHLLRASMNKKMNYIVQGKLKS